MKAKYDDVSIYFVYLKNGGLIIPSWGYHSSDDRFL